MAASVRMSSQKSGSLNQPPRRRSIHQQAMLRQISCAVLRTRSCLDSREVWTFSFQPGASPELRWVAVSSS